jgi:hypothetical protein
LQIGASETTPSLAILKLARICNPCPFKLINQPYFVDPSHLARIANPRQLLYWNLCLPSDTFIKKVEAQNFAPLQQYLKGSSD